MYLKQIKAHGFKSFADKINIDLNNSITGIVGPNGSGKSNVVDAVRWVLGEQSIKSLRGDGNMTDVIFSGSKSRNPLNVASVTLVFDNTDHYIPLDFTEIAIKRRLYKDGTNEYYLNGEKCRLKDITEILLDSGIAKESFNIISQGKVEEIISNKPSERRIIFEEAAGVLKYKKRKEEALRKLDKTHQNMERVNDIIVELNTQIEPLKEQAIKAKAYNETIKQLEEIEIALITTNITNINYNYQLQKAKIDVLNKELLTITTTNTGNEAKIEQFKLELNNLNDIINKKQQELLTITTLCEQINSKKNITLERKKYDSKDTKLHTNLINLKETELKTSNDIKAIELDIKNKLDESNEIVTKLDGLNNQINSIKVEKGQLENNLTNLIRKETSLNSKIEFLKTSIDSNSSLPLATQNVLNNPKLRGIKNAIGNIIEVDFDYSVAISVALGIASTYIITDSEVEAKEAINYLKNNHLGRATFFPLNIIKSRLIDKDTLNMIRDEPSYIGIASNLVKYDSLYNNVIENQLGNVIVVDNIDNANKISKRINHRYRIVTKDGDLINIGGSLTGGSVNKGKSVITEKYELEYAIKELEKTINDIKSLENNVNEIDNNLLALEDKIYLVNKDLLENKESINIKKQLLVDKTNNLSDLTDEIKSTNNVINNSISKEEEEVLNSYYETLNNKEQLTKELSVLINKRDNLTDTKEEYELTIKKENSLYNNKSMALKELEIEVNRMDVKLDNLLNILSDNYNMTYENAISLYKLEIPINEATTKVNKLKRTIKELGIVNLGAIDEYDRVSKRYDFLVKQNSDLIKAEDTLLEIIKQMDEVMEREFTKTFNVIRENFRKTFTELFKGGYADLKLTDPSDILETGIEIIASPPGKKLTSISLLSGGEKTFTAISLLFAILRSKTVPFCILDEVEAALDEVNVDSFGTYLDKFKDQTQFILITHKKRTMEYVDTLYGITMQESGVSKLVSVKLEDITRR